MGSWGNEDTAHFRDLSRKMINKLPYLRTVLIVLLALQGAILVVENLGRASWQPRWPRMRVAVRLGVSVEGKRNRMTATPAGTEGGWEGEKAGVASDIVLVRYEWGGAARGGAKGAHAEPSLNPEASLDPESPSPKEGRADHSSPFSRVKGLESSGAPIIALGFPQLSQSSQLGDAVAGVSVGSQES